MRARWDERLPFATLVVGVVVPGRQRVYPLDALEAVGGVVDDELDGMPIVVLGSRREGVYGGLAFSRVTGTRTFTFRSSPDGTIDAETGSRWNELGLCLDGPSAGMQLGFVTSHVSEWYVWPTHYPSIEIWSPEAGPLLDPTPRS